MAQSTGGDLILKLAADVAELNERGERLEAQVEDMATHLAQMAAQFQALAQYQREVRQTMQRMAVLLKGTAERLEDHERRLNAIESRL